MEIIKYKKKKNNQYLVFLDNHQTLELYEEVILNYDLFIKKKISPRKLEMIVAEQDFYCCYYEAIRLIRIRLRSVGELRLQLLRKEYSLDMIQRVLDKLVEQGYLNDTLYANSFLNQQILTTCHGPNRIKKELRKREVSSDIIDQVIASYDEDVQKEKVEKVIQRMIRTNKNKSNQYLIRKISHDLVLDGFSQHVVDQVLSTIEFPDDTDIREREYQKMKRKLESKYQGVELEYKIKQGLARKGFY